MREINALLFTIVKYFIQTFTVFLDCISYGLSQMCPGFNTSVLVSWHLLWAHPSLSVCPGHLVISLLRKLQSVVREHQACGKTCSCVTIKELPALGETRGGTRPQLCSGLKQNQPGSWGLPTSSRSGRCTSLQLKRQMPGGCLSHTTKLLSLPSHCKPFLSCPFGEWLQSTVHSIVSATGGQLHSGPFGERLHLVCLNGC